jgi:hypothetical protein
MKTKEQQAAQILSITPYGRDGWRVEFNTEVNLSLSGCGAPDKIWYLGKREDKKEDEMDIYIRAIRALNREKE